MPIKSKAKTRCYLVNNDTNKKLTLQFNPTKVDYGRTASYGYISSPGMSYPLTQYLGGEGIDFSLDLFYYDKPYSGLITNFMTFIKGLMPPEKNKKSFKRPPTVTLAYGYFVKTYVVTGYQVKDEELDSKGRPVMGNYTISIRQVST